MDCSKMFRHAQNLYLKNNEIDLALEVFRKIVRDCDDDEFVEYAKIQIGNILQETEQATGQLNAENVSANQWLIDFDRRPVLSGAMKGLYIAIAILLALLAGVTLLGVFGAGGVGALGGLVGFLVLPALFFAGMPWSLLLADLPGGYWMLGVAFAFIINGLLAGFLYGTYRKYSHARINESK